MTTQEGRPRYSGRWTVQLTQEMLEQASEKVRIEFNGDRQAFLRQAIHDALHGRGQETGGMADIQQDFEEILTHTRRTPQEITELKRLLQKIESHLIAVGGPSGRWVHADPQSPGRPADSAGSRGR